MGITVYPDKCTGCGACEAVCPFGAIQILFDCAQIDEKCTLCAACVDACLFNAISIEKKEQEIAEGFQGVWVFAEHRNGSMKSVSFELLAEGRKLADKLGTKLSAVCIGNDISETDLLIHHGANEVYLIDDPVFAESREDYSVAALIELINTYKPEILLAGATAMGRSFIPRVASTIYTGLTADCTGLDIDPDAGLLLQTRPTFGGNVMATIICEAKRPQMATVRPHVFQQGQPDTTRQGKIIKADFNKEAVSAKTRLINFVEDFSEKIKLDEANIIVSGGRGLGKPENFEVIKELADTLGAAVGSSRPPVDDGWIPYAHQVGQTGRTVSPKIYIACGISGAVQHLAGMQTAECIIAINEDPNAPIFDVATWGIVGDLFEIVPMLTKRLKNTR